MKVIRSTGVLGAILLAPTLAAAQTSRLPDFRCRYRKLRRRFPAPFPATR